MNPTEEQNLIERAKQAVRKLERRRSKDLTPAIEGVDLAPIEAQLATPEPPKPRPVVIGTTEPNPTDYIQQDYETLPFANPLELYLTLYPHLNPYKWQAEISLILGGQLNPYSTEIVKPTMQNPLYLAVSAANGSGKDCFVLAPFAVWLALVAPRNRCVITSSSHEQLRAQTENYIRATAEAVNKQFGGNWFDIVQYNIMCKRTGSQIKLFVTDEPGKAEGYHPFPDYPGASMAIMKNESKSIADPIADALSRCTGFNYWIDVSSPGQTSGFFYRTCTTADLNYPEWPQLGKTWFRRVTAYECPHISLAEINRKRQFYGEDSPFFRSSILAEFTSTESQVVIRYDTIYAQYKCPPEESKFGPVFAGLDFGGGGDENVLSVWHGNTQIGLEAFSFHDTAKTVEHLLSLFDKYHLADEHIIADDNGIGQAILYHLAEKGRDRIRRVRAQNAAVDKSCYGNAGAEIWFKFARCIKYLRFITDDKQLNQLANRYYEQRGLGKIHLERKKEARASGHPSPDRADATVLAFADKSEDYFESAPRKEHHSPTVFRQTKLVEHPRKYANFRQKPTGRKFKGSIHAFFS